MKLFRFKTTHTFVFTDSRLTDHDREKKNKFSRKSCKPLDHGARQMMMKTNLKKRMLSIIQIILSPRGRPLHIGLPNFVVAGRTRRAFIGSCPYHVTRPSRVPLNVFRFVVPIQKLDDWRSISI